MLAPAYSPQYLGGHHSTSDDSTRYRSADEVSAWRDTPRNPVTRFRLYLERQGWWTAEDEKATRQQAFDTVLAEMEKCVRSGCGRDGEGWRGALWFDQIVTQGSMFAVSLTPFLFFSFSPHRAEHAAKPPFSEMFTDVYGCEPLPQALVRQREELIAHLAKYPNEYPALDGTGGSSH